MPIYWPSSKLGTVSTKVKGNHTMLPQLKAPLYICSLDFVWSKVISCAIAFCIIVGDTATNPAESLPLLLWFIACCAFLILIPYVSSLSVATSFGPSDPSSGPSAFSTTSSFPSSSPSVFSSSCTGKSIGDGNGRSSLSSTTSNFVMVNWSFISPPLFS